MKKELAIILMLLSFLSLTDRVTGQDTLIVNSELVHQREADSLKAYNYFEKAQRFNLISLSDSTLAYISKSLEIALEKSLVNIEASDYELLASVYENRGDWEETLRNYLRAYESYRKIGDKEDEARILRILSWNYFRFGVYIKSAQYSEQEFLLYDEQDPALLASSSELAARSYFYLPVDSLSTRWYNAASVYYTKLKDTIGLLRCTDKLGTLFIQQEMYDRAFEEYSKMLSYYQAGNDF
jgi:tetratricopeptide (TPR) repeat protein